MFYLAHDRFQRIQFAQYNSVLYYTSDFVIDQLKTSNYLMSVYPGKCLNVAVSDSDTITRGAVASDIISSSVVKCPGKEKLTLNKYDEKYE